MDCVPAAITHLTHASNAGHNGVVKEIKLLSCFTEEEVNLIVIAHWVALGQALLYVRRANKGRLGGADVGEVESKEDLPGANVQRVVLFTEEEGDRGGERGSKRKEEGKTVYQSVTGREAAKQLQTAYTCEVEACKPSS
ncbi:hypothetical protein EYF80_046458 [Liparis tanakae]|uniref:Uncharacterized protein n=1 Tax=Liparis tanakae TaxID=230148 RepID=A0A4Z2FQT4_9TELE|nr:hypothetical protein EYF80_046458 [Liparis tanakae]